MKRFAIAGWGLIAVLAAPTFAQRGPASTPQAAADDPIKTLVGRLDLEKYKATIKGLTQFGDRRQGTDRNRAAVDWIEAQLKSYGCSNTERIHYEYRTNPPANANRGGGNPAAGRGNATGQRAAAGARPAATVTESGEYVAGPRGSGSRLRGIRTPTGVNNDPNKQPDAKLRQLNSQPATDGPRTRSLEFAR